MRLLPLAAAATVITAMVAAARLRSSLVAVQVVGISMQPTLFEGERVLVRRTTAAAVRRGQLVVFAQPQPLPGPPSPDYPSWLIKRVVALPGDPVPRDLPPSSLTNGESAVPPGKLVVLGDNRDHSFDSRRIGYIDEDSLLGVVLRRMTSRAAQLTPQTSVISRLQLPVLQSSTGGPVALVVCESDRAKYSMDAEVVHAEVL
jgi:signal peptidase I